MTKVSVVIPVYNGESYLQETVESAMGQTLEDIEIICVNDGSTDSSLQILERLAQKDGRIRILSQENRGLSGARNTGIREANGEYIYFLDADDTIIPFALESLYNTCIQKDLDILYFSGASFFDSEELKEKYRTFAGSNYLRKGKYSAPLKGPDMLVRLQENKDYIMSACLQIVKRRFLMEHQISFYEGIIHEDNIFTFRSLLLADRVFCISDVFFNRRVREDSIMTRPLSHRNMYGYFICLLQNTAAAGCLDLTEEQSQAVLVVLKNLKSQVVNTCYELSKEEVDAFYERCTVYERLQFDVYLDNTVELKRITNSVTFKIGNAIVWPVRVLKRFVLAIRAMWRK